LWSLLDYLSASPFVAIEGMRYGRRPDNGRMFEYDIALSFAGEQRTYSSNTEMLSGRKKARANAGFLGHVSS
jgi:hypothetical protein